MYMSSTHRPWQRYGTGIGSTGHPRSLGNGYQGFDIRFAVNCSQGKFNEEEGNFGKLLRLWQHDFDHRPPSDDQLLKTESDYLVFKDTVVERGFRTLAFQMLSELSGGEEVSEVIEETEWVGFRAGSIAFLFAPKINKRLPKMRKNIAQIGGNHDWPRVD